MRTKLFLGIALATAGMAGHASAETCVGSPDAGECAQTAGAVSQIVTDTVWGVAPFTCPIILNEPVFVKDGATLSISAGCVVRGQPRQAAVLQGQTAGTPGALIVTQTGKIKAVGTALAPVIFTTAATDNDQNGEADAAGFDRAPYGGAGSGDLFLDDDPLGDPLSPLNSLGVENTDLWGGLVILGNAPTNLSNAAGQGYGKQTIEGLTFPGFPAADAIYGGVNPHDSSGRLEYVSVRHGGDELGEGNELNCISYGAVGDGTKVSFVECYVNFDDGHEFFGGTVFTDHLVASHIGDDAFDLDQGFTGVGQFWFANACAFNENSGSTYGSKSCDKLGEWDGDDYNAPEENPAGQNVNLSTRFQVPGTVNPPIAAVDSTPWPLSFPVVYNFTGIGPGGATGPDAFTNPAASPLSAAAIGGKSGVNMRHGFAGRMFNAIIVNTANSPNLATATGHAIRVQNGAGGAPGFDAETNAGVGLIAIGTTTLEDVQTPTGATDTALDNGDAIREDLGAPAGANSANCVNTAYLGLTAENNLINPTGGGTGKLLGVVQPTVNPRPRFGACGSNGVPPQGPGLDRNATYRGAFAPTGSLWTDGWTALDKGGLL
ncbi:hypothetical protein MYXO_03189 [Myxococcaceae bacterium]|jgi:hypothetical protein|nr:hypothetical protein MYXO_03189 [Myxococcaceae bacterium]